jgi:DNA polymerase sigma
MIMAEKIAGEIDAGALGIKEMYLIGSTKNATAGPGSDIDLLVHFSGTNDQRKLLQSWIDGWGRCLSYINFQRTGYQTPGSLIDLHIITDEDIAKGDSYASLISAVDDRARPLKMR